MAIIKCKMCGGDITVAEDKTFGTCEYCGSTMTFPRVSDEQRAAAFNRGNHFRRMGEFDKALAVYERIVAEDDGDAEAHWCCALCRFGIEYVEDPNTYEWLPTCHRVSFDSFLEDVDYLAALEHSDGITRRQYQKDAAKIAEVQRGILATSQNTEPYDVFISYKELDAEGNRTRDSILAQDIYYQLTEKGWRVFFSRISLEDVPGTQYEPYIFAALNSAKVMIVVGTSAENLNAVWVKNEWSRYLSLMRKDRSKLLLPCYRDMDPYDLPEQLAVLMSYDMGKIGFIQDLIRGVDKVLNADKPKEETPAPVQERVIVQQSGGGPNVTALLKRGQQALEDGDWDQARGFYDQVLSMDAENSDAFLGLALAGSKSRDLESYTRRFLESAPEQKRILIPRDTAHAREMANRLFVPRYLTESNISALYEFQNEYITTVESQAAIAADAKARFDGDRNLSRALRYARGEQKTRLTGAREELFGALDAAVKAAQTAEQEAKAAAEQAYAEKLRAADEKAQRLQQLALDARERDFQDACAKQEKAKSPEELQAARTALLALESYKDAASRAQKAEDEARRLRNEEAEAAEKARAAKKKKQRKITCIVAAAAVLAIAVFLIVTKVILPAKQYKEAEALFEAGQYQEAIAAFEALGDYKDAPDRAAAALEAKNAAAYAEAETLLAAGQYNEAITAFVALGDYRDARERSFALWEEITQRERISAGDKHTVGLRSDGTVVAAGWNKYGQCDVSGWTDVVAVSAGYGHTVGLRSDGTVVAVGYNDGGQCDVSGWRDIVAVSAGTRHTVGLRSDGTVVATKHTGDQKYNYGQCEVSGWTDIVAVSAGEYHTVGLRADGTVVAVGWNDNGQCEVSGWTDIVAVSAGWGHTVGLQSDGSVVAVGWNNNGQCDVSGWENVVAVSAGYRHTVGLRADGTVVAVGDNGYGQCDVSGWKNIKLPN
jgi:tetratricopeptide (TPR) repeat protein